MTPDRRGRGAAPCPGLDREEVAIALSSLRPESASMSGPALAVGGERDETMRPACCRRVAERFASHRGLVPSRRARDRYLPDVLGWIAALR